MTNTAIQPKGIPVPYLARGVDPHEPYRQCTMSLDGPAIKEPCYAHDLVILGAMRGLPAFHHFPQVPGADGIENTCEALVAFARARGASEEIVADYTDDPASNHQAVISEFIAWVKNRLYVIVNGSEFLEMPLVSTALLQHDPDASNDAAFKLKKQYLTRWELKDFPVEHADSIVREGAFGLMFNTNTSSSLCGSLRPAAFGIPNRSFTGTVEVVDVDWIGEVTVTEGNTNVERTDGANFPVDDSWDGRTIILGGVAVTIVTTVDADNLTLTEEWEATTATEVSSHIWADVIEVSAETGGTFHESMVGDTIVIDDEDYTIATVVDADNVTLVHDYDEPINTDGTPVAATVTQAMSDWMFFPIIGTTVIDRFIRETTDRDGNITRAVCVDVEM